MSGGVGCYFVIGVSGQNIGHTFKCEAEDWTCRLSRNVCSHLPTCTSQRLRRAKHSTTPRRKSEISQI